MSLDHTESSPIVQPRETVTLADLAALSIDLADLPGVTLERLRRYPVLSEGGWFIVIKDQQTLQTISRRPWRLLGPIKLLTEHLDFG